MSSEATKIQAVIRGSLTRKRLKRDPQYARLFKSHRTSLERTGLYDGISLDDFGHEDLLVFSHRRYQERKKMRESAVAEDEKLFTLPSEEDPSRVEGKEKSQDISENDGFGSLSASDDDERSVPSLTPAREQLESQDPDMKEPTIEQAAPELFEASAQEPSPQEVTATVNPPVPECEEVHVTSKNTDAQVAEDRNAAQDMPGAGGNSHETPRLQEIADPPALPEALPVSTPPAVVTDLRKEEQEFPQEEAQSPQFPTVADSAQRAAMELHAAEAFPPSDELAQQSFRQMEPTTKLKQAAEHEDEHTAIPALEEPPGAAPLSNAELLQIEQKPDTSTAPELKQSEGELSSPQAFEEAKVVEQLQGDKPEEVPPPLEEAKALEELRQDDAEHCSERSHEGDKGLEKEQHSGAEFSSSPPLEEVRALEQEKPAGTLSERSCSSLLEEFKAPEEVQTEVKQGTPLQLEETQPVDGKESERSQSVEEAKAPEEGKQIESGRISTTALEETKPQEGKMSERSYPPIEGTKVLERERYSEAEQKDAPEGGIGEDNSPPLPPEDAGEGKKSEPQSNSPSQRKEHKPPEELPARDSPSANPPPKEVAEPEVTEEKKGDSSEVPPSPEEQLTVQELSNGLHTDPRKDGGASFLPPITKQVSFSLAQKEEDRVVMGIRVVDSPVLSPRQGADFGLSWRWESKVAEESPEPNCARFPSPVEVKTLEVSDSAGKDSPHAESEQAHSEADPAPQSQPVVEPHIEDPTSPLPPNLPESTAKEEVEVRDAPPAPVPEVGREESQREKEASPPPQAEVQSDSEYKQEFDSESSPGNPGDAPQIFEPTVEAEPSDLPKNSLNREQPTFRQEGPQRPYHRPSDPSLVEKQMLSPQTGESVQPSYRTPSFPVSYKTSSRDTEGPSQAATPVVQPASVREAPVEEAHESHRTSEVQEEMSAEAQDPAKESPQDSSSDSSEFFAELHASRAAEVELPKFTPSVSPLSEAKPRVVRTEHATKQRAGYGMKPITKIFPPPRNVKSFSQDMSLSYIAADTPSMLAKKVQKSQASSVLRQTLPSYSKRPVTDMLSVSKLEETKDYHKKPKNARAHTSELKPQIPPPAIKRKPSPYDFHWSKRMLERVFRIGVEVKARPTLYLPDMRVRKLKRGAHSVTKVLDLPEIITSNQREMQEREFVQQLRDGM